MGFQSSVRYSFANSVISIACLAAMSRNTCVVPLVGQWISRSATRSALASPIVCWRGFAPQLLPDETCRWIVKGCSPAVTTLIRAPMAARLDFWPISFTVSQSFLCPGF